MTTENDLIVAVRDALQNDGTLGKLKAEMRRKIMGILNGEVPVERPRLSNETLILNELIRDYLAWNGYTYTTSVFTEETGLNSEPIPRNRLLESLGVRDSRESSRFSVLHGILCAFQEATRKQH